MFVMKNADSFRNVQLLHFLIDMDTLEISAILRHLEKSGLESEYGVAIWIFWAISQIQSHVLISFFSLSWYYKHSIILTSYLFYIINRFSIYVASFDFNWTFFPFNP